jgi:signal transduction histidine kinase
LGEQARSIASRKLIEAHEKERTWIARELHDDVIQRLCLIVMSLGNLQEADTSPAGLKEGIGNIIREVSNLSTDIQRLSHRLHSSKLQLLGLAAAAAAHCCEVGDHHKVQIDLRVDNIPGDVSPDIALSIFRVLQEALQNALKHSGSTRFEVLLLHDSNNIHLTVRDSGRGFDAAQAMKGRGLGLTSMNERVRWLVVNYQLNPNRRKGRPSPFVCRSDPNEEGRPLDLPDSRTRGRTKPA